LEWFVVYALFSALSCLIAYALADGAGLACGIFEHLLSLGNDRPKVLAATHFHEIFENGYLKDRQELDFGHMEIQWMILPIELEIRSPTSISPISCL